MNYEPEDEYYEETVIHETSGMYKLEILGPFYKEEYEYLEGKVGAANIVLTWVHQLAMQYVDRGWIVVGHPIVSRYMQEASNGLADGVDAIKVNEVAFPFPFTQLLQMLLFSWCIIVPFLMVGFCSTWYAAMSFTFFIVTAFVGLNEIAIEMENPFGVSSDVKHDHKFLTSHVHVVDVYTYFSKSQDHDNDLMTP